ncbi:hypothetical protein [Jannaschia marina]|uniref:hypothetical protein n=1 Tax=Jannaschia marina TaxID=2741674 RepID=UPI0015C9E80F|nr:hypothetical protein [Jannaschia marina]
MHGDLLQRIANVEALMAERLYLGRGRLDRQLRAARGRLPRRVLRQARELVEAREMLANPATARTVKANRIAATCDLMERALHAVPEGKYRRRYWSARAGMAALNVLAVIALLAVVLWWRGHA